MTVREVIRAALLGAAVAACAPAAREADVAFIEPAAAAEATLIVKNDYLGEMDVFALLGSSRIRLGSVMTGRTAELPIPRALLAGAEFRLQADPVGPEPAFTFPTFALTPGVTVELLVAPTITMSSYSVW